MRSSKAVIWLSALIAVLALLAAGVGLFWQDGGSPFSFTTLRGETVQMYGQGLYRYETLRDGSGNKGADLFILVVGVPLLILFTLRYRRGSLSGGLLLMGTLAYFLYNSASMTFGYAYNSLFLVYLAQFSAGLFAFVLAFSSFDLQTLPARFSSRLPRRGIAGFLFAVGTSLILVWGVMSILPALLAGQAPALTGHTTLPTHALDMGIIAPVAILGGVLLLRRAPLGYLLAITLLQHEHRHALQHQEQPRLADDAKPAGKSPGKNVDHWLCPADSVRFPVDTPLRDRLAREIQSVVMANP